MNIYVEIEINGIIAAKRLKVPTEIRYTAMINQYIRNYFTELGYDVGNYLRIY